MERKSRLYSLLFPFSFLFGSLYGVLLLVPLNIFWDGIVLFFSLLLLRFSGVRRTWRKAILRVWLYGFAADLLVAGLLLFVGINFGGDWNEYISSQLLSNPYDNWGVLLLTSAVFLFAVALNYGVGVAFVFRRVDMERRRRRLLSLLLALLTAPVILFVPSGLLYQPAEEIYCFTNHIVTLGAESVEVEQYKNGEVVADTTLVSQTPFLADLVNHAKPCEPPSQESEFSYRLLFSYGKHAPMVEVHLAFGEEDGAFLSYLGDCYRAVEKDEEELRVLIDRLIEDGFSYRYTIVDQNVVAAPDPEWIARDDENNYYLPGLRSQYIILCFENGDVLNLEEALEQGIVGIKDLIRNGLEVIAHPIAG